MISTQKPPKAGPFYKAAFAFGRSPGKEIPNFLAGFFIVSFILGCWLYAFPEKFEYVVIIPFFVFSIASLFPIYVYGTKTALDDEKTQNYFAYFSKKEFWYVGSIQALLTLGFGLLFSGLEKVVELFFNTKIPQGGANAIQLFTGAFIAFVTAHVASGRSLTVPKLLSAASLAFAPSIGLYALFFMIPIFFVAIFEVFILIQKDINMILSAFLHSVLMLIVGYLALCGSVAFGKLYQLTTKDV